MKSKVVWILFGAFIRIVRWFKYNQLWCYLVDIVFDDVSCELNDYTVEFMLK